MRPSACSVRVLIARNTSHFTHTCSDRGGAGHSRQQGMQSRSQSSVQRQMRVCRRRRPTAPHALQASALEGGVQPGEAMQLACQPPQAALRLLLCLLPLRLLLHDRRARRCCCIAAAAHKGRLQRAHHIVFPRQQARGAAGRRKPGDAGLQAASMAVGAAARAVALHHQVAARGRVRAGKPVWHKT